LYGVVGDTIFDPFAMTPGTSFIYGPARAAIAAGAKRGLPYYGHALKELLPDFIPELAQLGIEVSQ
jgi:hypothetical protein